MVDQTIRVLQSITPRTDKERRSILDVCKRLERDVRDRFSDEQIQLLRHVASSIFDKDYFSRLERWVGPRLHVDFDFQDPTGYRRADEMVRDLAQEGLKNGISGPEIAWLASPEAENVWEFGYRLGQIDDQRLFLEQIKANSPDTVNALLLASYINGRANVEGEEFRERFLDQLAESRPLLAFACTWRGTPSRLGLDRVLRLVDSGGIPPESLGYLGYASWTHPFSVDDVNRLVKAMIDSGGPKVRDAASSILMGLSSRYPESVEKTEASIWRLVEMQPDRSWEWQWGQLVARIVNRDPKRVVGIVKKFFEDEHFVPIPSDEAMKALQIATAKDPEAAWEIMGDAMLKDDEVSMRLVISLTKWFGELIPTNTLISWAKNNQPRGPWIVSRIIVVGSPMPERARALLLAFPSDNRVKTQFAASLQTGFSAGPLSGRIGSDLAVAESWTQDPNPGIRSWARQLVKGIKARLKQMKTLEEEEEL